MDSLFQIPATVSGFKSMSGRAVRLSIDTQENLSDVEIGKISALNEKFGYFCFLPGQMIKAEDLSNLPPLPKWEEDNKSPAQRMRNTLYVLWEQKGKNGAFEDFYMKQMGRFIEAVKEKLT